MMAIKQIMISFRLAAVLILLLSGLAMVATAGVASASTAPGHTIATAGTLGVPDSASGGGGPIDFWKLSLSGGDDVQFTVPAVSGNGYTFALFAPGTTDTLFPTAKAFASQSPNDSAQAVFELMAPYTGTFILAVCEATYACTSVENGGGQNPMSPYTFTTTLVGGFESRTSLKLSATTVTYGHEKSVKFSVTVSALFGGTVTGKVSVSDGKKTVCTIKLAGGKGSCTPTSKHRDCPGQVLDHRLLRGQQARLEVRHRNPHHQEITTQPWVTFPGQ
jgi:hypothetical protein